MPSQELEPITEVSGPTVGEFLEQLFPGRDIVAGLERGLTVVESFAKRISSVVEPVVTQVCEVADRLDKLPPPPRLPGSCVRARPPPPFSTGLFLPDLR